MHAPPPSFPYGIFVEAPDDLESLQAMAAKFDANYKMSYRDNGMEFRFTNHVAAVKFILISGGRSTREWVKGHSR
jgi:hypothetical protein